MRLSCRRFLPAALSAAVSLVAPLPAGAADAQGMTSDRMFGYNVGALPRGELLTKVSATWNVAVASQHVPGEPASARAWMGLGSGCVTYDCRVQDDTRVQIGTTSSVEWGLGVASARAWFRLTGQDPTDIEIPVEPGDEVRASMERVPGNPLLWRLAFRNLTSGVSWTRTVPVASALASARWVVESDVSTDEFGQGYALMPDLTVTRFDDITLNGAWPRLRPEERVTFVPAGATDVAGTPSLPQPDGNGFAACAWATTCAVPPNR